jgi:DNA polymerase
MPVPLRYSGAHTHRFSGDWKLNLQNLPRGGQLRRALAAPNGSVVVAADASQIEARIVAWLAKQTDLLQVFADRGDPYSTFASKYVYNRPITKADKVERFVGKPCILGLGFGMGAEKFRATVKQQSAQMVRVGALPAVIEFEPEEAQAIVSAYRRGYANIHRTWSFLDTQLNAISRSGTDLEWGPVRFEHERVRLPNGLYLYYHKLYRLESQWGFTYAGKPKYIFGGKLLENIVQALARIVITDAALRIEARTGQRFALQVHDELVYVVREADAAEMQEILLEEMKRGSEWTQGLPLDAEASMGPTYGDAK